MSIRRKLPRGTVLLALTALVAGADASADRWSDTAGLFFVQSPSPPRTRVGMPSAEHADPAGSYGVRHGGPLIADALDGATLSAAAANASAAAANADDDSLIEAIAAKLDAIALEESASGENSSALIEDLEGLGALYRETDAHSAAIVAHERALQLIRVSRGLYTLDQVPVVEQLIASRLALGELSAAVELQQYLLELAQRNPDDPRVPLILSGVADREMVAARHLLENREPEVSINVQNALQTRGAFWQPPSWRYLVLSTLYAARRSYGAAIVEAQRHEDYDRADLFTLQDKMIETLYFELRHPELRGGSTGYPKRSRLDKAGTSVLAAKIRNSMVPPATAVDLAEALIELGDWQLLFAYNAAALEKYRVARDVLIERDVPSETIQSMLSPERPAVLSALANTGTEGHAGLAGHVDLSIEINRYGRTTDVEILGASPGTSDVVGKELKSHVLKTRFRPRFAGEELVRSDRFSMRYLYGYSTDSAGR